MERYLAYTATALIGFGLVFDLLTLVALVSTLLGRRSSGFPPTGIVSYPIYIGGSAFGLFGPMSSVAFGCGLLLFHVLLHRAQTHAFQRALSRERGTAQDNGKP